MGIAQDTPQRKVDGEVIGFGSVELSEVGTLLLGPAKAKLQTFENARAALSDFMYSELS
jgi:hypothetical protein